MRNSLITRDLFDTMFAPDFLGDYTKVFGDISAFKNLTTDIATTDDAYIYEISIPGVNKDEIALSIEDGFMTVKVDSEKKTEDEKSGKKYQYRETKSIKLFRKYQLPENVIASDVSATYTNGILEVTLPKASDEESKVNKIEIQ